MGEESELRVVIGDLCPLPPTLALLRRFFDDCPGTRLHLHFEAIAGPWERLFDGEADLILHHINKADPRLEFMELFSVRVVPVVAPGFLRIPVSRLITPEQMRGYVQCVIGDTSRHSASQDYFLVEGARSWTAKNACSTSAANICGAASPKSSRRGGGRRHMVPSPAGCGVTSVSRPTPLPMRPIRIARSRRRP